MNIRSTTTLVETLQTFGLLELDQLVQLREADATVTDPRTLAGQLLRRGWLTAYQVNQLMTGHAPGLVLGSYVLLERLGAGGMGQVFKARHQKLGRVVALKVILKERLQHPDVVQRFRREIQAVAQLSHPNIVLAFDADEVDGTHFYTMEYVDGMDLATRVRRLGPVAVATACDYIRQAACGLAHIHEHGLVHRDIKPSNLLVTHQTQGLQPLGLLKLLDLGLARLRLPGGSKGSSQHLTGEGLFIGTPDFVAPEQAADPHEADIRSDLYSLGCTFYYLLSGSVPFPAGTPVNKLFSHRLDQARPIEKLRPEVPPRVAAVVRRLMAKEPAARYQEPIELARDLQELLDENVHSVTALAIPSLRSGPRLPVRKRRWLLATSGTAVVACVAVLIAFLLGSAAPDRSDARTTVSRPPSAQQLWTYVRRPTRTETVLATLKANGLPTLEGKWHLIGPFDSDHQDKGFDTVYPPEREIRLDQGYPGKKGRVVRWQEFGAFRLGAIVDLRRFEDNDFAVAYLYHAFEASAAVELPLGLGSDDTLTVWFNGERLLGKKLHRGVKPDEDHVVLRCRPGKNELLLKVCNHNGAWGVYALPAFPPELERTFGASLQRDFAPKKSK